jgi:WD40 repeat protein
LLFPRKTGRRILIPSRQRVAPSPNGRWLAYDTLNPSERKKGKAFTLHLFDTKTGKARTLEPRNAYLSSWSPDSRQLLVSASDPRTRCVSYWRVPVPAGRPRLVHGC